MGIVAIGAIAVRQMCNTTPALGDVGRPDEPRELPPEARGPPGSGLL